MARANLDTLASTVHGLLEAALEFERMPAAIEGIRHLFDGSKACLARFGPGSHPGDAITNDADPDLDAFCGSELAGEVGFFIQRVGALPVGKVYQDHVLFGEEHLRSSRVWREWMAPQDMYGGLGCRVLESGPSFWICDVQRGRGREAFDAAETALFARLMPVVQQAAALRRHLDQVSIEKEMTRRALDALSLAVMIVDRSMRLVYANEMADDVLASPDGAMGLRGGRLFARDHAEQGALKTLVVNAGDPAATRSQILLRAPRPDGRGMSVRVQPMPPGYGLAGVASGVMVLARILEPASDHVAAARELFGMTEAEAKVASALASGLSLAEAAQAQGVRITTARTHLARIFQKTGTRQQSQVAALLRAAELPVRDRQG